MDDDYFTSQLTKSEQPSSSESGQRNISLAEAIDNFYEDERARGLLPLTAPCLQNRLGLDNLLICHSTSAYPCDPTELNLNMIHTLAAEFDVSIGYSGHETGLSTTVVAAALGACLIERHITVNRAMWGSDQAASVEPAGVARLVRDIRVVGIRTR